MPPSKMTQVGSTMMLGRRCAVAALLLLLLVGTPFTEAADDAKAAGADAAKAVQAVAAGDTTKRTRQELKALNKEAAEAFVKLKKSGQDEVGHTKEAALMRAYQLRKKKRKGILRKRDADFMEILFPGVTPEEYVPGEDVFMFTDLVQVCKKWSIPNAAVCVSHKHYAVEKNPCPVRVL
jgi:hypothetical protein